MGLSSFIPGRFHPLIQKRWPAFYQYVVFGTFNLNTQQHWDAAWAKHNQARATAENPEIQDWVLSLVPKGSHVLDVGCGVGETMVQLRDRSGCQCSGLDISSVAVAAVQAKGMTAKAAVLPEIPYPDTCFDAAVCTETLEHVTEFDASLRSIYRVLKPGGLLLLSIPDGEADEEASHVHRMSLAGLRQKLTACRFSIDTAGRMEPRDRSISPSFIVAARR